MKRSAPELINKLEKSKLQLSFITVAVAFFTAILALTGCDDNAAGGDDAENDESASGGGAPVEGIYRLDALAQSDSSCSGDAIDITSHPYQHVIVEVGEGALGNAYQLYWCGTEPACSQALAAEDPGQDDNVAHLAFFLGGLSSEGTSGFVDNSVEDSDLCVVSQMSNQVSYDADTRTLEYQNESATKSGVERGDDGFCGQEDSFDYGPCNGTVVFSATLLD